MGPDATSERTRAHAHPGADRSQSTTRRRALAASGTLLVGAVAGCATFSSTESTPTEQPYRHLRDTTVYLDDDVDLDLPESVSTATAPDEGELLVLPGGTDVDAERAVGWLDDGRVLALLGDGAEATWIEWARTDVYADTFDSAGYGRTDPKPDLLVAAAHGSHVSRYNKTWGNGPDDADIARELDETLADIENRTPRE